MSLHRLSIGKLLEPVSLIFGDTPTESGQVRDCSVINVEPYTKIVEEIPEMRRDTVELVKKAVGEKRQAYILVNHRSEGNAPLAIQALRNALHTG